MKKGFSNVGVNGAKIFFGVCIVCALVLSYAANGVGYISFADDGADEKKEILVGYIPNYGTILEPAHIDRTGYGYDYLKEIGKYTGWTYKFVPCGWEQGMRMLERGELDMFGPMRKTPEREELYAFPNSDVGYEYGAIYTYKNRNIGYDEFEKERKLKVGTVSYNYYTEQFEKFADKNNLNYEFIYTDVRNASKELEAGRYDIFVDGSFLNISKTRVIERLESGPSYYVFKKDEENLAKEMSKAQEDLRRDKPYFLLELQKKYYNDTASGVPVFTKRDYDVVAKYPKLVVGYEKSLIPLQYTDVQTGKAAGLSIDILEEISKISGIEFEFVPVNHEKKDSFEGLDLILCRDEKEIREAINLTDTYHTVSMVMVGKTIPHMKEQLNIGILNFNSPYRAEIEKEFPGCNIYEYQNVKKLSKALAAYQIDCAMVTIYSYDQMAREEGYQKYATFPSSMEIEMKIGVAKTLPDELIYLLDKAIAMIPKYKMETITFGNTVGRPYHVTFNDMLRANSIFIIALITIIAMIMLALVILVFWSSKSKRKALQKIAYVDEVTDLPSFQKFKIDVGVVLKNAKPNEYMMAVMDIDKFKYLNDSMGFEVGSTVLKVLADHLKQQVSQGTFITRQNADHFVFCYRTRAKQEWMQGGASAEVLAKKIEAAIGETVALTFSIGTYIIADPAKHISSMIDRATMAKKSIKNVYGNAGAEFTVEMEETLTRQREVSLTMAQALINGEFLPYLQPKYLLLTGEITGAEVLVRWMSPKNGMLDPGSFIPIFEKNGFIRKLDLYMFEKTCEMIQEWRKQGITKIPRISVNVSEITFMSQGFTDRVEAFVNKYEIPTRYIEIELTESLIIGNIDEILTIMFRLKKAGFFISIDDFGSGYSSLNLLKDLPVDILKIDKGFLSETLDTAKGKDITDSIISMSKKLHLETVAEGIETLEQAESLLSMGCDIAQGYYFARPMPRAEFEKLLKIK